VRYEKFSMFVQKLTISRKHYEICTELRRKTNKKSFVIIELYHCLLIEYPMRVVPTFKNNNYKIYRTEQIIRGN